MPGLLPVSVAKCFWPTIKRGRCKNTFAKIKFIFFDLQPSTRSENSRTSKAWSKGAPQVTLGLMKSKARTWVFFGENHESMCFVQKKPFLLVTQKGNIIFKTTILKKKKIFISYKMYLGNLYIFLFFFIF